MLLHLKSWRLGGQWARALVSKLGRQFRLVGGGHETPEPGPSSLFSGSPRAAAGSAGRQGRWDAGYQHWTSLWDGTALLHVPHAPDPSAHPDPSQNWIKSHQSYVSKTNKFKNSFKKKIPLYRTSPGFRQPSPLSPTPTPVYTCYKISCQAPPPPMSSILKIKQPTDKSVKFVCNNNRLSYIHMKKAAKVTSSVSSDFCSHLGHFGKAGSCDDIDCFGIVPGIKQTTSFISSPAISHYSQKY